jgi:hypothetical protein
MAVTVRSQAQVCGRSVTGNEDSNPEGGGGGLVDGYFGFVKAGAKKPQTHTFDA